MIGVWTTRPSNADSVQPERFCLSCRQPLRGVVSRRCPECGRAFDPDDPRTTSPHEIGDFRLGAAALTRMVLVMTGIVACAAVPWSAFGFQPLWLFFPGLVLLPFMVFMLAAAALPVVPLRLRDRALAVLSVGLLVSVLFTHWPLRVTFALHRPWLEPIADQVLQEGTLDGPRWVGIFRFQRIIMHPSGNVGFKLTSHPGGGIHIVRQEPGTRVVWYNAGILAEFGRNWYLVDED